MALLGLVVCLGEPACVGMGGGWGGDGVRQVGDWVCGLVVCGVGVWVG